MTYTRRLLLEPVTACFLIKLNFRRVIDRLIDDVREPQRMADLSAFPLIGGEPEFRGFPQGSPEGTLFEFALNGLTARQGISRMGGIGADLEQI